MEIDLYVQSRLLLERLANSIYDRDPANPKPLFFSAKESHVVESWLKDILSSKTPGAE